MVLRLAALTLSIVLARPPFGEGLLPFFSISDTRARSRYTTSFLRSSIDSQATATEESIVDDVRPVAVVTGVSRSIGIGRAVAQRLKEDGFQVVVAGWRLYDDRMPWGSDKEIDVSGDFQYEVDLEDATATEQFIPQVTKKVGQPISVLVLCHCESVDSDIFTTTVESFDKHMAINARSTWQLIQGMAKSQKESGEAKESNQQKKQLRIISITSDHTAGNLPYGASKGAMDRIVLAAALELRHLGGGSLTCNVINPGATDTGWMTPELVDQALDLTLQPRVGMPSDVSNLVSFLCSEEGQWINGQTLYSNGGLTR